MRRTIKPTLPIAALTGVAAFALSTTVAASAQDYPATPDTDAAADATAVQDFPPPTDTGTPDAMTATVPTAEQDAQRASWPTERQTAYELWPEQAKTYYWTLAPQQQDLFWRLTDDDKVALAALPEPDRERAWTAIESRAATMGAPPED